MKHLSRLAILILLFSCGKKESAPPENEYPIQPVPFTRVEVTDDFWARRIETNHRVTIPIALQKSRETGRIDNFKVAAGLLDGEFRTTYPFDDSDIYKIIEGAAYSIQMFPDPALEATIDTLVTLIGLAQEEDGYLYTNRTIMGDKSHPWAGSKRWELVDDLSHELYNLGHFYEAATAWAQATGKREILDIAIKSAELVDRDFGPGKIENWPGHQEIEIGLVKLFRMTGEKRYLDLAKFFLDIRGRGTGTPNTYNQSHLPVIQQSEAVGHSVRAAYMWSGMADVAALTGDSAYIGAISRIWEDVVHKKFYITGGIGAEGGHEGFGGPYELPNARAYCETCAAIANVFWNHRMFLMTGESKYIDALERSLYNNVLSGVSLSGDRFFYPNPLESDGRHARSEWFGCACCPSNICRFIPSMPGYIYASDDHDLFVNLYIPSCAKIAVDGDTLIMEQQSKMPWEGKTSITLQSRHPVRTRLHLRIPHWATSAPFPGDLYTWGNQPDKEIVVAVNGVPVRHEVVNGYAVIDRKWKNGDIATIDLPLGVRKITAHQAISDNRGKMALQRGPLVYCAEYADQPKGTVFDLIIAQEDTPAVSWNDQLPGPAMTLSLNGWSLSGTEEDKVRESAVITAIPYYEWSHRGKGEMAVWLPAGN